MPAVTSSHYALCDNIITLFRSDGNSAFRPIPGDTVAVPMGDGTVDYMHECTGNDPTLKFWKVKIGTFLAEKVLELPGRRKYALSELPRGYSLFVHKKGDRFNPRLDAYLLGSSTVNVFRSPAEFFFHAKWILLGCPKPKPSTPDKYEELFGPPLPEEFTDRCGCKYCSGADQGYISRNFSNYRPKKKTHNSATTIQARFEGQSTNTIHARFEGVLAPGQH